MRVLLAVVGIVLLTLARAPASLAAEQQQLIQPVGAVRVTAARANVRLQPTTESPVITTVSAGMVLELLEKGGDWHTVLVPGPFGEPPRTGYIFANLVEVLPTSAPAAATEPVGAGQASEPVKLAVDQPARTPASGPGAYRVFVSAATDESGFSDQELQDSAQDIRRSVNEPPFHIVATEAEANVLLVVVEREVKVGEPTHARVFNALTDNKQNQINEVYATISVKRDGRWQPGIRLSSNQCCGAWRSAADEVVAQSQEWLENNYPLSSAASASFRPPVSIPAGRQALAAPMQPADRPHQFGVGGQAGGFSFGVGPSIRYWSRETFGFQVGLSRYGAGSFGDTFSLTQIAPSVLFVFGDPDLSKNTQVRPYVGGGLNFIRASYRSGFGFAGAETSSVGFQGFVGVEAVFSGLPKVGVSGDIGYYSTGSFAGITVGGFGLGLSGHYYFK